MREVDASNRKGMQEKKNKSQNDNRGGLAWDKGVTPSFQHVDTMYE